MTAISDSHPVEPTRADIEDVLELRGVSFSYGRSVVLSDVSLTVRTGDFVAVVGANGAGKSTLMRLSLGLLEPAVGEVRILNTPLDRFRDWAAVGYVPQRATAATVLPLSVDEVVLTGLAAELGLVRRANSAQRARIDHVLDLLELRSVRGQNIVTLSGGQQQRALIARALVTAPRLLVLDEPTTGIDSAARAILRDTLEHLVEVEGAAVVYVSHDPEGFAGLADRTFEVAGGRLRRAAVHDHPHLESEHPTVER